MSSLVEAVRLELRLWFSALTYYTRVPAPEHWQAPPGELAATSHHLPLIGWLVGLVAAGVYGVGVRIWGHELALFLSLAAAVLTTGAFHEDGLADMVDGLGGGWTREEALAIMKDSRHGTYGVLALIFAVGLKALGLWRLEPALVPWALIAGQTVSRTVVVSFFYTHSYARETGKARGAIGRPGGWRALWLLAVGLAPLGLLGPRAALVLVPLGLLRAYLGRLWTRRLGGYTGDCLGAAQQLSEVTFYLTLASGLCTST